jgi:VanZ family protein
LLSQDHQQATTVGLPQPATASTFARVGLLMYTFLIAYASLYPLSQWHDLGLKPSAFLLMPLPHYWTRFDVGTNIVGYLPFGMLVVFSLYPLLRGAGAAIVAVICGALLSGTMEAVQTFLPSRVSSNLDFLTNVAGTILGAIAGDLLTLACLEESRLVQLRRRWFIPEAGRGLIVIGLWPLAQIYPQAHLFGHGELAPLISGWLTALFETPIDLVARVTHDLQLAPQEYWLAETLITACGLTGVLLSWSCLMRKHAPRPILIASLLIAALAVKLMANALLFTPANAFSWLTPGAKGGLLLGIMMVTGLAYAPQPVQRRLAAACLLLSVVVINLVPANPYFVATLQSWIQGKFLNFNGAAHFLSLFWPMFALWFLLHPAHRMKRK